MLSLFDIKMVKGVLGIQNKTMSLSNCFVGIEDYQVYYAKTIIDGANIKYYEIVFDKPEMKNRFKDYNIDKELHIIRENDMSVLIQQ